MPDPIPGNVSSFWTLGTQQVMLMGDLYREKSYCLSVMPDTTGNPVNLTSIEFWSFDE